MSDDPKLGATGEFPQGKLNADDEGGIICAVSIEGDKVRIDFGPKAIAWVSIDPDGAIAFASAIVDKAMAVKLRGAKIMREAFKQ